MKANPQSKNSWRILPAGKPRPERKLLYFGTLDEPPVPKRPRIFQADHM